MYIAPKEFHYAYFTNLFVVNNLNDDICSLKIH